METQELMKYLENFAKDSKVSVIVLNDEERTVQYVEHCCCITDQEKPVFFLELGEKMSMDEEEEQETCSGQIPGQDSILNHPEYMPDGGEKE